MDAKRSVRVLASALVLFALLFTGDGIAAPGARTRVLTGRLQVLWGDPATPDVPAPAPRFHLTTEDGATLALLLPADVAEKGGGIVGLNGRLVTVTGTVPDGPRGAGGAAAFEVASIAPLPDDKEPVKAVTGSQPWISIMCKFADDMTEPRDLAFFQGMYASTYPGLDHYWREQSYNTVDVAGSSASGWYVLPLPRASYLPGGSADLDKLANDCLAAADPSVNFAPYVGINLMFNDDLDCCAWGGGHFTTLDGVQKVWRVTWDPPWAFNTSGVIGHEMGHGFGLPHSSGMYGQTYDNFWDVMSVAAGWYCSQSQHPTYGCLGQHTISRHKDQLGWIPPEQKFTVTGGTSPTINLEQLALPQTDAYRMAEIPIGNTGRFYTVEVRRLTGYDVKLPGNAVVIHEVALNRQNPARVVDIDGNGWTDDAGAMFLPGETFTDAANFITVTVNSATATGFNVTLSAPLATTTTVTSSVNPSVPGQSVTFTATVSNGATGTVTFAANGTTIGTGTLSSGVATFTTSSLAAGSYSISADYEGDGTRGPSTGFMVQTVVPALRIGNAAVTEGGSGTTTTAAFNVSLSSASASTVTVNYNTVPGTASGGITAANSTQIVLPNTVDNATPYPSTITLSGVPGTISKVSVSLHSVFHTYPRDMDILLVGPGGQSVVLLSDAGAGIDIYEVNLTFDDGGAPLTGAPITSGVYQPTNIEDFEGADAFEPPAPASGYGSALSVFNGTSANGTWSLYVVDDFAGDIGAIDLGWSLAIATTGGDYVPQTGALTFSPGTTTQTILVPVNGDTVAEPNETFTVQLSDAVNAVILDGTGNGTIGNDDGTAAAPANLTATASGTSAVALSWTPVANAGRYRVYRRTAGNAAFVQVGSTVATAAYTDTSVSPNAAYLYRVHSLAGSESAGSNVDLATTTAFTDPTLTPQATRVKAVHFNELLTAVNAVRALAGLTAVAFDTPAPASAAGVKVRRQHLLDLRNGLDAARSALALTALGYTDPTVTAGSTKVRAVHLTELRNGVK